MTELLDKNGVSDCGANPASLVNRSFPVEPRPGLAFLPQTENLFKQNTKRKRLEVEITNPAFPC
jgi:hypothetical protein